MEFLTVFWKCPTTFQRFPKILQNLFKGHMSIAEHFLKISEDCHRLTKTFEEDQKMFWSHTNEFKDNLKLNMREIIEIFTSEDMENKLRHWSPGCSFIWILWVMYFLVKHLCLYNNCLFCVIKRAWSRWARYFSIALCKPLFGLSSSLNT